jgi:hypothetical protein
MDVQRTLDNLRGKHIKVTLQKLERAEVLTPQIRKIVLDQMNDLMREVLEALGYTTN